MWRTIQGTQTSGKLALTIFVFLSVVSVVAVVTWRAAAAI